MTLEIKKYPDPVLKRKAEKVDKITPKIKELIFNMKETLHQAQGVGLAAPQIGILERIIVVQTESGPQTFINPEITRKSRETETGEEGCLCLPGSYLKIKRAKKVEITALDINSNKIELKAEGLLARIFQHEIDHLDGVLILDKIPFWQRWKFKKQA